MKICVAQTKPLKGDIAVNISRHKFLIEMAIGCDADLIVFPELSLTGYEPELAKELSANFNFRQLSDFQQISNTQQISIAAGLPLQTDDGVRISMVIFQPNQPSIIYSKQYLHEDEFPYFVEGKDQIILEICNEKIAPAICYEISVPAHAANAFQKGANIYVASVAKSVSGIEKSFISLSEIAKKYSVTVLMSNCIGHCDHFDCGGKSSVWNHEGRLIGQLDDEHEGILVLDTETGEIFGKITGTDGLSFVK